MMLNDPKVERFVVGTLGGLAMFALLGIVILSVIGKAIPDVLQNVSIGSMTAVAGILAKTGSTDSPPQPVTIENTEPVEVEDVSNESFDSDEPEPVKKKPRKPKK